MNERGASTLPFVVTKPMLRSQGLRIQLATLIITAYQACIVELQLSVLHQTGPDPDSQISKILDNNIGKRLFLKTINKIEDFFTFEIIDVPKLNSQATAFLYPIVQ